MGYAISPQPPARAARPWDSSPPPDRPRHPLARGHAQYLGEHGKIHGNQEEHGIIMCYSWYNRHFSWEISLFLWWLSIVMLNYQRVTEVNHQVQKSGWWYAYPSEKWWNSSVGMMTFPIYGKIKAMFQTTNQHVCMLHICSYPSSISQWWQWNPHLGHGLIDLDGRYPPWLRKAPFVICMSSSLFLCSICFSNVILCYSGGV